MASEVSAVKEIELIKKKLGYVTFNSPPTFWLKSGSKRLNYVMGSRLLGIPYGKLITLAGKPSSGKTMLALRILGKAQKDGALVAWVDVENSFDADWARLHGLDVGEAVLDSHGAVIGYTKLALFRPEFGLFGKTAAAKRREKKKEAKTWGRKKDPQKEAVDLIGKERQETAEELFTLVEEWLKMQRRKNPQVKIALGVDSTTAIQPEEEMAAGLTEQNMRTRMSLAPFLNLLTKRWVPLALHTNSIVILISQLRTNPRAAMFGNPEYVPGGNGILFYPSIVCWMRRVRNIKIRNRVVGLEAIIRNRKNKAGGGSVEYGEIGVKAFFEEGKDWEFVEAEDLKGERE